MKRAALGCTRADLPAVEWDVDEQLVRKHLGRLRRVGEVPHPWQDDPDRMLEEPEDGCPGGDQRSWFVQSLLAGYMRRRDQQGNRVSNLRLDRCDDDLILDAISYFEVEESACASYCTDAHIRKLEEGRSRGT